MNEVWNEVFDSKQEVVLQGLDPPKISHMHALDGSEEDKHEDK
jgi:hypothetical protein